MPRSTNKANSCYSFPISAYTTFSTVFPFIEITFVVLFGAASIPVSSILYMDYAENPYFSILSFKFKKKTVTPEFY